MTKRALLVIDMLNDFILPQGSLTVGPAGEEIVPLIAQKIAEFREAGQAVIYICDNHKADDPEFAMFPPHCIVGTPGAEIIGALAPQRGELIIPKRRYSAFFCHPVGSLPAGDGDYRTGAGGGLYQHLCSLYGL